MGEHKSNKESITISINKKTAIRLNSKKVHPRETYDDVIKRLLGSTWGKKK